MDVMHERVAGLDVHKETIVACVRIMAGGKASRECRTFDTTTTWSGGVAELADGERVRRRQWKRGVYWKPV
jgi:transposase